MLRNLWLLAFCPLWLVAQRPWVAPVRQGELWGLVNATGAVLAEPSYDYIGPFAGQDAVVDQGGYVGLLNTDGKLVLPTEYDLVEFFYPEDDAFTPRLGAVRILQGEHWGLANPQTGEEILAPDFEFIDHFSEGRVFLNRGGRRVIRGGYEAFDGGRWALADAASGDTLSDFRFFNVTEFRGGYAVVSDSTRMGVLDRQGRFVVPMRYSRVEALGSLPEGGQLFVLQDSLDRYGWAVVNNGLKQLVNPSYTHFEWHAPYPLLAGVATQNGLGVVEVTTGHLLQDGLEALVGVDADGYVVGTPSAQLRIEAEAMVPTETSPWVAFVEGRYRFFNVAYTSVLALSPGYWAVEQHGLWGVVKSTPPYRMVLPPEFRHVEPLSSDYFAVFNGTGWQVWSGNGQPVSDQTYRSIRPLSAACAVGNRGESHYIVFLDEAGREEGPFDFVDRVLPSRIATSNAAQTRLLDLNGQPVAQCPYPEVRTLQEPFSEQILLGLAPDSQDAFWLLDENGAPISPGPMILSWADTLGYLPVQLPGGYSLLDTSGYLLPPQKHPVAPVGADRFVVRAGEGVPLQLIDAQGKPLGPNNVQAVGYYRGGVLPYSTGAGWGALDRNGRVALLPNWEEIGEFQPAD